VFLLPSNTIGIYISSNGKNVGEIFRSMLKMPLFHSIFVALLITNLSIEIPSFIEKSIHLLGNAAIPMLLFILGLQLAKIRFNSNYLIAILIVVVIRLLISPLISYFTLNYIGISGLEKQIAVIQTSAPAAVLPLMYAIKFNRSPDLLAAAILVTTILSGFTLTLLIFLLN
jgi:predicted permease